jgi:hypothetical protein
MVPDCLLNLGGNGSYEPVTVNVNRSSAPSTGGSKTAVKPRTTPKPKPSPSVSAAALPTDDPSVAADDTQLFSVDPETSDPSVVAGGSSDSGLGSGDTDTVTTGGSFPDTPTDKGPIGLLAIIATVCVVGVSVGAIRAIVGQRASRAEFA